MRDNVHTKTKGNMTSVHFDSLLEMMDYINGDGIDDLSLRKQAHYNMTTRRNSGNMNWYGRTNKNAKEALNHGLLGDSELMKSLQTKLNILQRAIRETPLDYENQVQKVKRVKTKSDFGDELDIHKVYQGQCDTAWTRTKRVEVDSKIHLINIVVDICTWSSISVEKTLWRAAVAVKIVDQLVKAGKSVKLSVGYITDSPWATREKHGMLSTTVTVKNYNEHLPLERVAGMCNAAFFRSALFASMYVPEYNLNGHKGSVVDITENRMPIHMKEEVDAGHAKYVVIGQYVDEYSALAGMASIYEQMKEFSKGE